MKQPYFINYKVDSFHTCDPMVIDLKTMEKVEKGLNYLDPDDFVFLCEADSLEDAVQRHRQDLMMAEWERSHP